MLLYLHYEIAIGFVEVILIFHGAPLNFHDRLLATDSCLELGRKFNHFELLYVVSVYEGSRSKNFLDNANQFFSLVNYFKVI